VNQNANAQARFSRDYSRYVHHDFYKRAVHKKCQRTAALSTVLLNDGGYWIKEEKNLPRA